MQDSSDFSRGLSAAVRRYALDHFRSGLFSQFDLEVYVRFVPW